MIGLRWLNECMYDTTNGLGESIHLVKDKENPFVHSRARAPPPPWEFKKGRIQTNAPLVYQSISVQNALATQNDQHGHADDNVKQYICLFLIRIQSGTSFPHQAFFHGVRNTSLGRWFHLCIVFGKRVVHNKQQNDSCQLTQTSTSAHVHEHGWYSSADTRLLLSYKFKGSKHPCQSHTYLIVVVRAIGIHLGRCCFGFLLLFGP